MGSRSNAVACGAAMDIHISGYSAFATNKPLSTFVGLAKLAEEASAVLDLFSKQQEKDEDIQPEYQKMVDTALDAVSKIHRQLRVIVARKDTGMSSGEHESKEDETKRDSTCIICYNHMANVLLVPCHHLSLCMVCATTLYPLDYTLLR